MKKLLTLVLAILFLPLLATSTAAAITNNTTTATINVAYFDEDSAEDPDSVRVWGQAPIGAETASVTMRFLDGSVVYEHIVAVNTTGDALTQYTTLFGDANDFPIATYQAHVHFYDNKSQLMTGHSLETVFDTLLTRWNEQQNIGFDFISTKYFEVWNPQTTFMRPISWSYTPEHSGNYAFALVNTHSTNGGTIRESYACQYLNAHQTQQFSYREILFTPAEDIYHVRVEAQECGSGVVLDSSNNFAIIIDDLTKPWPTSGVHTVLANPDVMHYAEGIYWTNTEEITARSILGSTVGWHDNESYIKTFDDRGQNLRLYQTFDEGLYQSTFNIGLQQLQQTRMAGTPEFDIEACGYVLGGQAVCGDVVSIGYDTNAPVIIEESLNPRAFDIVSGEWDFSADVTDEGVVNFVELLLVNKANSSINYTLPPTTNVLEDLWAVSYDTTGVVDGYYDFSIYAQDYAGNSEVHTIELLFDNSKPKLLSMYYKPEVFLLGQEMIVSARVTDELSGVATVNAEVTVYTCDDTTDNLTCTSSTNCTGVLAEEFSTTLDLSSCEAYARLNNEPIESCLDGVWSADLQEPVGELFANGLDMKQPTGVWFEIVINATDAANNSVSYYDVVALNSSRVALDQGYDLTITSVMPNPVTAGQTVTVQGTLQKSNDGLALQEDKHVMVNDVQAFVSGNTWGATIPASSVGVLNIQAVYTSVCEQEFATTTKVTVDPVPDAVGGGAGFLGTICDQGYERVNGACVPVEQNLAPASSDPEPAGTSTAREDTRGALTTQEDETEEQLVTMAQEEGTQDDSNLLTGAVVGGGFSNWGWLVVLGGLALLLAGGFLYVGRR